MIASVLAQSTIAALILFDDNACGGFIMQTISINLPDSLGDYVRCQSAERGVDEYFEDILRERQREQARDKLEAELIKGIESGLCEPITPNFWQEIRKEGRRRSALKKGENV